MNRFYFTCALLILLNFCNNIEVGEIVKLPPPVKVGGGDLYEALNHRQSLRDFNNSIKLSSDIISQALWSCYGVRDNNKHNFRTTPSAKGWFPLLVYIFLEDGVYKYYPVGHSLIKIYDGDHRKLTGTQTSVVTKARVNFVFIADFKKKSIMDGDDAHKMRSIYLDSGHVTMALSLFASANNMKGVVRAMVDTEPLLDFLKLNKEDYIFTIAYSLGY